MHQYKRNFINFLDNVNYSKRRSTVLEDFMEMAKIAIANPFYQSEKLEQRYLEIVKKYPKYDVTSLCEMLAQVIKGLEYCPEDFLGEIYMEIIGSQQKSGQFFTPYHVCDLMVRMTCDLSLIEHHVQEKGYITVAEPASGAGIMLIALRNLLNEQGYGTNQCFAVTTDCDRACMNMTYIQLSLLGIPALVQHGNSLTSEIWEQLYTAPYFASNFPRIFQAKQMETVMRSFTNPNPMPVESLVEPPDIELPEPKQLSLF